MRSTQARATLAAMAMLCWGQLAVAQITSLEVLVLDSPPFTCSDAAPCYSTGSLRTDGFEGCRAGSRRTKNGVCVHGLSVPYQQHQRAAPSRCCCAMIISGTSGALDPPEPRLCGRCSTLAVELRCARRDTTLSW